MKKCFALLPIAALALASCSNSEDLVQNAPQDGAVDVLQIRPAVDGMTRGESWTDANFTSFFLTTSGKFQTSSTEVNSASAAAFSGATVAKSATDGKWYINGATAPYYWPSKSAVSDFLAYNVAAGAYEAKTDADQQKDIVVAYNPGGKASDFVAGVPLYFRHILSQIVFKADNKDKNDVQIKIAGIRLNNIYSKGTFTLPTASTESGLGYTPWSEVNTAANYLKQDPSAAITLTDGDAQSISLIDPQMLIPQDLSAIATDLAAGTGTYLSVLIQVQDLRASATTDKQKALYPVIGDTESLSDQGYAWAAVNLNTVWEAGKKYIYTLHFSKDGFGKVDPKQEDGGTPDPAGDDPEDPKPGDDIVDSPVELILDVNVVDWTEVGEEHTM